MPLPPSQTKTECRHALALITLAGAAIFLAGFAIIGATCNIVLESPNRLIPFTFRATPFLITGGTIAIIGAAIVAVSRFLQLVNNKTTTHDVSEPEQPTPNSGEDGKAQENGAHPH